MTEAASSVSLLHQKAAVSSRASPLGARYRDLKNPALQGHMLTAAELSPIENIECLEAKQRDPAVNCSMAAPIAAAAPPLPIKLNVANFPSWKSPSCNGEGEFFCDPDKLLTADERKNLTALMKELRKGQHITCGPQLQHDPVDKWHYDPFYLGVAIAKDWPLHESDAQSLQSFGRILAGRWNMTFPWDGSPSFYARCPNEAMLIILPDKRQAHLSSPSCMFVCEEKGGPEVATATVLQLDSHGLADAVKAGMSEVYKVLAESTPMHKPGWQPVEKTAGTWGAWDKEGKAAGGAVAETSWEQSLWDWSQRVFFGIAVLLLAGSLAVSVLVCYLAPGMAKDLNKPVV